MSNRVARLSQADRAAILELLGQEAICNLFLIGFVEDNPVDRGWWYGTHHDGALVGVVLVLPGRLAVPFCPDSDDAARIGDQLYHLHRPTLIVGPRAASDALWARWARGQRAERAYDQRLYQLASPPPGDDPPGFRRALYEEWPDISDHSAAMELEDLGIDPSLENPQLHDQVVQTRIKSGKTWVIEQDESIRFQINVGTAHPLGVQVGGTYVPPEHRGRGHAKRGVAALGRRLLARYPRVTLHVNEANAPAIRVYEGCGFVRDTPFRLITPRSP